MTAAPAPGSADLREALVATIQAQLSIGPRKWIRTLADALIAGPLAAEVTARAVIEAKNERLRAQVAAAVVEVGEQARLRGEAEGKMRAAEMPGILDGWIERAKVAETQIAALAAERDGLRAALEGVTIFFDRPHESRRDAFERVAAVFHRETGVLRPGKDSRTHDPREQASAWEDWVGRKLAAARAALHTPTPTTGDADVERT